MRTKSTIRAAGSLGAVLAVLALVAGNPEAPRAQGAACDGADANTGAPEALEAATECLINAAREQAGLTPLHQDARLVAAARAHARQMVDQDVFQLDGPEGATPQSRAEAQGYGDLVSEAIGLGSLGEGSPRGIVTLWLSQPDQRAVLLTPDLRDVGLGVVPADGGRFGPGSEVYAAMTGGLGPPVPGRTVLARVVSGAVTVRSPGDSAPRLLTGEATVRVGAVLDTTAGRIELTAARDRAGAVQTSQFYDGAFVVGQHALPGAPAGTLITDLRLVGPLGVCPRAGARPAARGHAHAAKRPKRGKPRRVWGDGKGNYRTTGKVASATVRGTKWLTEDRCSGTYVRVARGVVRVRDRLRRRTVTVRAGHAVLIKAR